MVQKRPCINPRCGNETRIKYRFCEACRKAKINHPGTLEQVDTAPPDIITEKGNEREQTVYAREEVRTLDDLIRVCSIDTSVWDIVEWQANKWEMGWVNRHPEKEDVAGALPLFQIKARMRRKSGHTLTMQALREALVEDIRAEAVRAGDWVALRNTPTYPTVENDWLFEFAPFDLHMGKLTWDEETVTNYDISHAEDLFNASLDFLLERAQRLTDGKISRVLCVFGNDVSHIDNKRGETTKGTPLDVDTRYIKVYRRIVKIHRRALDILRTVAPVDVVVVPGNHDELTSFHLGEILSAVYENDPQVSIDNSAKLRKYYEFGTNLFGFTHGDSEKVSELPLTMAREMPEAWARCESREWHIGHKHISEKFESRALALQQDFHSDKGVRVRRLTSLSAHDAWHTKHAYMDRRACEGFVFHKTAGFTDHLSFNVDHFTGEALSK
jgi:hypothetical protein